MFITELHTRKNHQKHKKIIDRKGFFYEIGSDEFDSEAMVVWWKIEKKDDNTEKKCSDNPYYAPEYV
jgi:hypothetical protein